MSSIRVSIDETNTIQREKKGTIIRTLGLRRKQVRGTYSWNCDTLDIPPDTFYPFSDTSFRVSDSTHDLYGFASDEFESDRSVSLE
jgi:hypothetical protein